MKKLFIGCGILVLLLLAGFGFLAWKFWPDVRQMQQQAETAFAQLVDLRTRHPFDPAAQQHLDAGRFSLALDVRAQLEQDFRGIEERLGALERGGQGGEEAGVLDILHATLREMSGVLPNFARRLDKARMSWPELAWHSRLLWAVLHRIDVGAAEPELAPLKGTWDAYAAHYERLAREQRGLRPLRDVVGDFPPAIMAEASALVAQDIPRVRAGLGLQDLEHLFLSPVDKLEDLQYAREIEPAGASPAPAAPPAPAPAGADAPR